MSATLRSPLDRAAPLIFAAIGAVTALGVVVFDRYRDNEIAVWAIFGIGVICGLILWVGSRFSPIARRRVCKVCGLAARVENNPCPKCGGAINWRTVRMIPQVRESPIPYLRNAARASGGWLAFLPYSIFGLLVVLPPAYFIFLLVAAVAVSVPLSRATGGRKMRDLIAGLEANEGSLCTVCGYPRSDGGDRCPECGLHETPEEVRAQWERSGLWIPSAEKK